MNSPDPQMEDLYDQLIVAKATQIFDYELDIDPDRDLYLFTWSPDPSRMPDTSFERQHDFNIDLVSSFFKGCECGIACVESTQLGNPHYHGWYQVSTDPNKDKFRIVIAKTFQQLGLLKITKSKGHYYINYWKSHSNCLFYYKKELLEARLLTHNNPVTSLNLPIEDWTSMANSMYFKVSGKRESVADLEDKITLREFYKQFYSEIPEK